MPDNKKMVEIRHFKMSFGDKTVIKDLSFDVFRGEVFGFLGSNGSGKTTTLRALLGLYQPTAGDLLINSKPYSVESQIRLGYLPEERGLYKKEKVLDVMLYFGQLKGLSRKEAKDFSLKFLERVNLSDKANTQLDKLSGGQQQNHRTLREIRRHDTERHDFRRRLQLRLRRIFPSQHSRLRKSLKRHEKMDRLQ